MSATQLMSWPLKTARLTMRPLCAADAPFIVQLLNEPGWLRFIGDKQVRTEQDAVRYLERGPMGMFTRTGMSVHRVGLAEDDTPIGVCGLVSREALPHPDLGFAFLAAHHGCGYAQEASEAILRHARVDLGLEQVLAITTTDNASASRLLERLGFVFEAVMTLPGENTPLKRYAMRLRGKAGGATS